MIITKTPFRISFLGGGTDLPAWYCNNGGKVLSTAIDKYCYVTCRYLPPFFDHKYDINYSKIEKVKTVDEIEHPVIRECIKYLNITKGLEIHYDADLPAKSGIGTSSSFTVGLLNALHGLKGEMVGKEQLAREAIDIERNKIGDTVGSQDQVAAAFGGFNEIEFLKDDSFVINPITMPLETINKFKDHLMLFFTGFTRFASNIEKEKVSNFNKKQQQLLRMMTFVPEALNLIKCNKFNEFGGLLHEAWKLKKTLSEKVSTSVIDEIYEKGLKAGAKGGKLLGAGGGGFILFFAKPENHQNIRKELSGLLEIPFGFDNSGSQIIFYKSDSYDSQQS